MLATSVVKLAMESRPCRPRFPLPVWEVGWVCLTTKAFHPQISHSTKTSLLAGPAPVRPYMDELLPDVLDGRIEPGRVFGLDEVPEGYRAMDEREAIKVMVKPQRIL